MSLTIQHKRGASWHYAQFAAVADREGALVDMTGVVIESQIRSSTTLVATLACAWENPVTQVFVTQLGDTSGWPLGRLQRDVKFTFLSGDIVFLPTETVEVFEEITRAAP